MQYSLNGLATKLIGQIAPYSGSNSEKVVKYTICDENDKILYSSEKMKEGTEWQNINLDVKNVLYIKLKVEVIGDFDYNGISPAFRDLRILTTDY